jgi:two-component system alkaline phosphatase synthesis response regulator PhoP
LKFEAEVAKIEEMEGGVPVIWCVEDDASIRDIEVYALTSTGFEAKGFEDGNSFWNALQAEIPELVVLDVMLPGQDGISLLKRMKQTKEFRDIPVIMATAKGSEYDKIQGLDLGADDYLVKPFGIMEMVSRVKAVLRRCKPVKDSKLLKLEGVVLNPEEHTVTVDGERVILTHKEYELLYMFLSQPGIAFTREQLLGSVWNTDYVGETRTVDMHIRTLRQKLGAYGCFIETVRNVGYRLEAKHDK